MQLDFHCPGIVQLSLRCDNDLLRAEEVGSHLQFESGRQRRVAKRFILVSAESGDGNGNECERSSSGHFLSFSG